MNIVYPHCYVTTPGMVGQTRSYELARRLTEAGHRVTILTCDQQGLGRWVRMAAEAGIGHPGLRASENGGCNGPTTAIMSSKAEPRGRGGAWLEIV